MVTFGIMVTFRIISFGIMVTFGIILKIHNYVFMNAQLCCVSGNWHGKMLSFNQSTNRGKPLVTDQNNYEYKFNTSTPTVKYWISWTFSTLNRKHWSINFLLNFVTFCEIDRQTDREIELQRDKQKIYRRIQYRFYLWLRYTYKMFYTKLYQM